MRPVYLGLLLSTALATTAWAQDSFLGGTRENFRRYCAGCHGNAGDGQGENADWIDPKPRDFTLATFKCRSTPSGTLPTDDDLYRTIKRGLVNSNMPSWKPLLDSDVEGLVQYIKTFSPRWKTEKPGTPITVPPEIPVTADDILAGRALFQKMECWKCHGPEGRGNGPSASTLTDSKDQPIKPFNFAASSRFKCGTTNQDLYKIFLTGLDGTPMPSFADNFKGDDAWHLVHFLRTLQQAESQEKLTWNAWVTTHQGQIKPIGPDGGGQ
jgi:mono/diheme cytochrome c family protein